MQAKICVRGVFLPSIQHDYSVVHVRQITTRFSPFLPEKEEIHLFVKRLSVDLRAESEYNFCVV